MFRLNRSAAAALLLVTLASGPVRADDAAGRLLDNAPTISRDDPVPASGVHVKPVTVAPVPEGKGLPAARSQHGDWTLRCTPHQIGAGEDCALMEAVVDVAPDTNIGLTVLVLKGAGNIGMLMRIMAPNNVLLPPGIGLEIDGADIGRAAYVRCPSNGCISEVQVDDSLLTKLRNGRTATFIFFNTPGEGIAVPISLNGFSPGIDSLP